MLSGVLTVIKTNDKKLADEIRRMDDDVDELYTAVKMYLTQISREELDPKEGRRWAEIIAITINLEHVGDIVEHIVEDVKSKKIAHNLSFSDAGMQEIEELHGRLMASLRLGLNVFLNGDLRSAQRLLAQKVEFRELERAYADTHLNRLTWQTAQSIETSSLHLDIINDFKRINSHIAAIASRSSRRPGRSRVRLREDVVAGATASAGVGTSAGTREAARGGDA